MQSQPAPFLPGQRIVDRNTPAAGSVVVTQCVPHPRGGFYVSFQNALFDGAGPAERYVLVPENWQEAPPAPRLSAVAELHLSTDGWISPAEEARAQKIDANPERRAERAAYFRALAEWYKRCVSSFNPSLAEEEDTGLRHMADAIETEARS